MKRRELREHIFQLLFRVEFNGQDEMEEQVSLYVDDMKEEEIVEPKDETYIEEKYKKIVEKLPEIDELLEKYSKGWKLSRMNKVDLTILRLGVYEINMTRIFQSAWRSTKQWSLQKNSVEMNLLHLSTQFWQNFPVKRLKAQEAQGWRKMYIRSDR